LIAIRIDPNLLNDLRKEAEKRRVGYQTLIHEILSEHAHKQPA
jgi:predicted DNA binding CopG/RHH family protein